jgi:hypothetical protein
VELQWTWPQHLLASITAVVGLGLIAGAIAIARPRVLTIFAHPEDSLVTKPITTAVHQKH